MPEARASRTIVIERPIAEVFAFMTDYRNNPRWQEGLVRVEQADVPPRVGSSITTTRTVMGRTNTTEIRVTTYEENRRFRSNSASGKRGPVQHEGGYDFEPAGESATRVIYEGSITTGRLLGPVGRLLAKGFQKQMNSSLERLKTLLETTP